MRDSALKPPSLLRGTTWRSRRVGEELMRDSALKLVLARRSSYSRRVGEELMRDSALKHVLTRPIKGNISHCRRRAHARQRFETSASQ